MTPDGWSLYEWMLKSRLFEEAVAKLWNDGLISGEMHTGRGEEAVIAGVVSHLRDGDAMALDHRGTAALLMRGVDPVAILRELLGHPDGLCGGQGGHMHLFSKEHLAASSGIVGAEGPAAAGFALSAHYLRPGSIAVAFFGEGAMNQGMLMESMNLAAAWKLPVLFVCKDDSWAITTRSQEVTGGHLTERARELGVAPIEANGLDVGEVFETARSAVESIRSGGDPVFLHARCVHLDGHLLGFQPIRVADHLLQEMPGIAVPLARSLLQLGGARLEERIAGLKQVIAVVLTTLRDPRRDPANDPVRRARASLEFDLAHLNELEDRVELEISRLVASALQEAQA